MLPAGSRLGSYEIVSSIGAGGMGEVWRARDSRIGRDVAIKVLPASLSSDGDRLRRFEQEARTAGSLNHPNLVTIFELGAHDGAPFIVMELLEGETLRDKLGGGLAAHPLPHRKTIDYSSQLATGLAAAHDKGVIHRDLKPENIFVTKDGRLKILDFGLAKLRARLSETDGDDLTQQKDTAPGTVMGTVGYMSPEQVRGQDVDQRSDIFSFGTIVYEMLSGRRAFHGPSSVETMNEILHKDPSEIHASGEHGSPALERIVRRCLEKDREERFHSARDVAFAMEAISASSSHSPVVSGPFGSTSTKSRAPWVVASVLALAVLALVGTVVSSRYGGSSGTPPLMKFSQLTFEKGIETQPALSPDGKTFAFVKNVGGQSDIFVQRSDGQNAINLTRGSPGNDSQPSFSPDGSLIAFSSGPVGRNEGGIFVMGATGESVRRLTESGFNPAWSPDGKRIVYASEGVFNPRNRNTISTLSIVTVADGTSRILFKGDAVQPRWSPNGQRIAFWSSDRGGNREIQTIAVGAETSNAPTKLTDDPAVDWNPVWSADGDFLYFLSDRDGTMNLWRVAIDQESGLATAAAESLRLPSADVAFLTNPSSDGRFLYQSKSSHAELRHIGIDPEAAKFELDPQPLFAGSMLIGQVAMSPDAQSIAFTTSGQQEDVHVMRADGTEVRQLTNDAARDRGVSWWPDGSRVLFYSNRGGSYEAWSIRPDGSGVTQLTTSPPGERSLLYPKVSPDGKWLAYHVTPGGARLATLTGEGSQRVEKKLEPYPGSAGLSPRAWSPNGRRLLGTNWGRVPPGLFAYSLDTQSYELIDAKGIDGCWIDDVRVLVFRDDSQVVVTDLRTGVTRIVGQFPGLPTDVSAGHAPAGGRHLLVATAKTEADIWMMSMRQPADAAQPGTSR